MQSQIYTLNSVFNFLYQAREKEISKHKIILYSMGFRRGRSCALVYRPDTYHIYQHISFYALSSGWEQITKTGYKSVFFQYENGNGTKIPSYIEMKAFWEDYCKREGLPLDEEVNQMKLF